MKLIAVLFLAGLALSYALPAPEEFSLDEVEELDFVLSSVLEAEERSIEDDIKQELENGFGGLMEKAKLLIKDGHELDERFTNRIKFYIEKLKEFGFDVQKKAKEMGKYLSGKVKEAYQKFLERLGINGSDIEERSMVARSLLDELKKSLEEKMKSWMEQWKEQLEQGRQISEKAIETMKSVLEKAKRIGMDMDTEFRKWADDFTGEAKKKIEEILDKLGVNKNREKRSIPNDVKVDLTYILKMKVQRLKSAIEEERHDDMVNSQRLMTVMSKLNMPNMHLHQVLSDVMDTFKGNESEKSLLNDVKKDRENMLKRKVEKLRLTILEEQQDRDLMAQRMSHLVMKLQVPNSHVTQELDSLINAFTGNERKRSVPGDVKEHLEYTLKRQVLRLKLAVDEEQLDRNMIVEKMMHLFQMLHQPSMYAGQELDSLINSLTANESDAEEGLEKILKVKLQRLKIAMDEAENDRNNNIMRVMHIMPQLHQPRMHVDQELQRLIEDFSSNGRKRSIIEDFRQRLREAFDQVLGKITESMENGKGLSKNHENLFKDLFEKLKNFVPMGDLREKITSKGGGLSGKAKELFENFLERIGLKKTRAITFADEGDNNLRERFEELMQKIKDALENGKSFQDGLEKLKELRQKLKDLRIDLGEKGKEMVKKLRETIREYFKKLLEKFKEKRSFNFQDILKKLKEKIRDEFDPEEVKEKIEDIFGKKSEIAESLINKLKEKGEGWKNRILEFLDRFLEKEEKRSIKEVYEKIREYLKNLKIELKEKFTKFGEWAKDKYEKGLEQGRDRAENLKKLAKEFIADAKNISKDVAEQAKEFFREYKEDLGNVYEDVRDKIRDILAKKE